MQPTAIAVEVVRRVFAAYETGDRSVVEEVLADAFTFSSPPDPDFGPSL
jgi:hypothetical protein